MCFSPSGADTAKWTNRLSLVVWKQASQVTPVHQKLGNSHPKYKVFHHEHLPKLTSWGMPFQVRSQTYKPRKLSFCLWRRRTGRGRHWCRVCSKGIPPNEVFPVNLVSGRRLEIWKCRTENHLMCLPSLTWIYVLLASRKGIGHATNRAMLKWDQTQSQHRQGMLHAKEFTTWVTELSSFSVSPLILHEMWRSKVWMKIISYWKWPEFAGLWGLQCVSDFGASTAPHGVGSAPGWFQPLRPGDPSSCPGRGASL